MKIIFQGKVEEGDKRGRTLGYPTANTLLGKHIEEGIYISQTKIGDKWLPSLTFIGSAQTFNKQDYKAETYILDFNQDIYGQTITVHLLEKLRGNQKFESAEGLVIQMKEDEKQARVYFQKIT